MIGVILIFYFLFTSETKLENKRKTASNANDLASLLSGAKGSDHKSSNSDGNEIKSAPEESIFESDFMKPTKGMQIGDDPNDPHHIPQGDIPVNPQTGQPYNEEAMKQFEELRKEMPKNDLIPRRMTPEEKASQEAKNNEIRELTVKVSNNSATKSETERYYAAQEKVMQDRLEIIKYLIKMQEDNGEEDKDGQFKKILDGTNEQIKNLEEQKKNALGKFP